MANCALANTVADKVNNMKKREHWEIKGTLNENSYVEFSIWCKRKGASISNVLRVIVLAAQKDDPKLDALLKAYDPVRAKP